MWPGCARKDDETHASAPDSGARTASDRTALQPVSLPDLSRVAESVRRQVRERYALLTMKIDDPRTRTADLVEAYGGMGGLFMAAEYLDAAESCLLNAQRLAPSDFRWPYYLGHLYRKTGQLANSAAAFERSLELRPADVTTLIWLGTVYFDQGRLQAAEPLFARARSLEPQSVAALFGLGRAALATQDYVRAVEHLEQALARDGQASIVHYPLAMAYRGLGELDKAEAHLRQRGDVGASPSDPLMEELDGLLESAMAYQSRGIRALERRQWAMAASDFRRGIELGPDTPSLRHRLGTALFMMGHVDDAVEQFETALRLSPDFAKAHYSLGVIIASRGRYADAIERFSAAVRSEPDYVEAHLALADTLRGTGRSEQALRQYESLLTVDPRIAEARFGYAMTLVGLKRYQRACESLVESARLHPDRLEFTQALTRLLAAAPDDRVRDGRRAMELMQQLLKGPRSIELSETMAMTLAELGHYQEAVAWQHEAIAAAAQTGHSDVAQRMAENLKLYEAHRPCRTPWRNGELP